MMAEWNYNKVKLKIKDIILTNLEGDTSHIVLKDSKRIFNKNNNIDSINIILIFDLIETEFDIEIEDNELNHLLTSTLENVVNYVLSKLSNNQ
ncbi:MAG: hypothetical protein ACFFG0_10600 [Candidatus Thorarchaeota archaeon]